MTIDRETGIMHIAEHRIWPQMTREEFLHSSMGKISSFNGENDSWARYNIVALEEGIAIGLVFYFHCNRLRQLEFCPSTPPGGPSPPAWSEEAAEDSYQRSRKMLIDTLQSPSPYLPWGEATATKDIHGGGGSVLITYREDRKASTGWLTRLRQWLREG